LRLAIEHHATNALYLVRILLHLEGVAMRQHQGSWWCWWGW